MIVKNAGYIGRLFSFRRLEPRHWIWIFGFVFIIHIPAVLNYHANENLYCVMARSFLHGRLSIPDNALAKMPGTDLKNDGDMITYDGKFYSAYPPAPALLLLPFIFFFGSANPILIAVLLTCLNIFLIYSILSRLRISEFLFPWLIYGFVFGTGYWYVVLTSHHMYGFAQVVSVTSIFLFLNELFGKKRSWLLGLFLGISFLCRQFTIVLTIFGVGYLIHHYLMYSGIRDVKIFRRKIIIFCSIIGLSAAAFAVYNYARFGSPIDMGYEYMNYIGIYKVRVEEYGVFSVHYVLVNLYNYLLKGFNIEFTGPGLMNVQGMDSFGSAILIASPFLVASFKSGWDWWLRLFAWVVIGVVFTGLLFYHSNGKNQVNTSRYVLDFLPIMFVLTALGADKIPKWLFKSLVIYAIAINIVGFIIHFKFHTLQRFSI